MECLMALKMERRDDLGGSFGRETWENLAKDEKNHCRELAERGLPVAVH